MELDLSFCFEDLAAVGLRLVARDEAALGEMEIVLPTFLFLAVAAEVEVADLMLSFSLAFLNARLFFSLAKTERQK